MSQIVDNSPELALDDPQVTALLTGSQDTTPAATEKPDVKAPSVSSAETKPADQPEKPEESDDPEHLKAQIRGLKSELSRRAGNSSKVEQLEAQLASLQEKVEGAKTAKPEFEWIQKLDDEGLTVKQTDWDDELADARARYAQAETSGDERGMERQGQRILMAKKVVAAFKREVLDRSERRSNAKEAASRDAATLNTELADMFDSISEQFPEFQDSSTELWKAGDAEYRAHPQLMARLGPVGEVVAAAMAIVRNPDLVGKKSQTSARRDVLGKLEGAVKRSLSTGAAAPTTQRNVNIDISNGEGLANFNAYIDKLKGG